MIRRESWMRRNNVSAVDLLLVVGVGGGLTVTILAPSNVAKFVEPSASFDAHRGVVLVVLVVFAVAATLVVGRLAATWGPVRVDRAVLRWQLSGPASRSRALWRRLASAAGGALVAATAVHGLLALVVPDVAPVVLAVGAASGAVAVSVAYIGQLVVDRRTGEVAPSRWRVSPGLLHRRTFSPCDGFAAAVGLAITMMDASWIADARVTRWQRRNGASASRLPCTVSGAFVRMDLRRLRRHPESVIRWLCWTVGGCAAAVLLDFHAVPMLVSTLSVWAAGVAVSGGLVSTTDSVLARSFGVSDGVLRRWHSVVPAAATLVAGVAVAVVSDVGVAGGVVMVVGAVTAVLRRALRPPLPFDAPMVIEPLVTGAAFAPTLLSVQVRGLMLAVVTGIVAGV